MKSFAATKASLIFMKNRCRSSRSQMFFKISILKNFPMFTGKHLYWSLFLIKLQAFRFFPVNIAELLRTAFFIEHLRWLLLQMSCFTLHFQKDVAEYIAVLHCIIVSFWNVKLLSFAFIRCTTVVIRCTTRCYSTSFIVTRCHSLSLAVVRCHSLNYSLSLVVIRCHLLYYSSVFL